MADHLERDEIVLRATMTRPDLIPLQTAIIAAIEHGKQHVYHVTRFLH
jgi:hypothetical protein